MALDKTQILQQVNTLLADFSDIVPTSHRQTMYDLIDKVYDETIDGVSLVGTDLVFTRNAGAGSSITIPLSAPVDSVNGQTGVVLLDGEDIPVIQGGPLTVTQAISDLQSDLDSKTNTSSFLPVATAGSTILFDNNIGGRRYAAAQTSATITLDFTGAVDGAVAQFTSDGTEVTISSSKTVYVGGSQNVGFAGSVFLMYDATNDAVFANWVPSASTAAPSLSTPTLTLSAEDGAIGYIISDIDANADNGVMEISDDGGSTWQTVSPIEYDGDPLTTSGAITLLTNGTLYQVRLKYTASGYVDSAYATDSATPVVPLVNTKSGSFNGTTSTVISDANIAATRL